MRRWNDDLTPRKNKVGRPKKTRSDKARKALKEKIESTTLSDTYKRQLQIWEVYWQPGLPWYPTVKEVAEQFGVTRQAVHTVKGWAVKNGHAVRDGKVPRHRLSPHDAINMCERLWNPEVMDKTCTVQEICEEYGIAKRTAYDIYRPLYKNGTLHAWARALDEAWRKEIGLGQPSCPGSNPGEDSTIF